MVGFLTILLNQDTRTYGLSKLLHGLERWLSGEEQLLCQHEAPMRNPRHTHKKPGSLTLASHKSMKKSCYRIIKHDLLKVTRYMIIALVSVHMSEGNSWLGGGIGHSSY